MTYSRTVTINGEGPSVLQARSRNHNRLVAVLVTVLVLSGALNAFLLIGTSRSHYTTHITYITTGDIPAGRTTVDVHFEIATTGSLPFTTTCLVNVTGFGSGSVVVDSNHLDDSGAASAVLVEPGHYWQFFKAGDTSISCH